MKFKTYIKLLLPALVLLSPGFFSLLFSGCDSKATVFEIIGQEVQILKEGPYTDVLIQVRYQTKVVSLRPSQKENTFVTSAYATSPAPPKFTNNLSDFKITANMDFDAAHPAGSNLLDRFNVVDPDSPYPITSFPHTVGENRAVYLKLKQAPSNDLAVVFNITSSFDNGFEATTVTKAISILK